MTETMSAYPKKPERADPCSLLQLRVRCGIGADRPPCIIAICVWHGYVGRSTSPLVRLFLWTMARQKQAAPLRREPSDFESMNGHTSTADHRQANGFLADGAAAVVKKAAREPPESASQEQTGLLQLVICVAGIYASL